jgi:hypothetical protein
VTIRSYRGDTNHTVLPSSLVPLGNDNTPQCGTIRITPVRSYRHSTNVSYRYDAYCDDTFVSWRYESYHFTILTCPPGERQYPSMRYDSYYYSTFIPSQYERILTIRCILWRYVRIVSIRIIPFTMNENTPQCDMIRINTVRIILPQYVAYRNDTMHTVAVRSYWGSTMRTVTVRCVLYPVFFSPRFWLPKNSNVDTNHTTTIRCVL